MGDPTTTMPASTTMQATSTMPAATSTMPTATSTTRFPTTSTMSALCPQATLFNVPASVVSRYFGIGFNIYLVNNNSAQNAQSNLYLIEHIPIIHNTNTFGSMYSISNDGQLTIKLRNEQDNTQWWTIEQMNNNDSASNQPYYIITPFSQKTTTDVALQYENGNLALRPYSKNNINNIYESQKWITSNVKVTRGIPVLNYNPASMFTPEFDPYSTSDTITSSSLDKQNSQQVSDVLNTIKTNIRQYLTQIGGSSELVQPVSASSLGNKEMPLTINFNLKGTPNITPKITPNITSSVSKFANINGSTTQDDMLSLLDKYVYPNNSNNQYLYSTTDLTNAIASNPACKPLNLQDYTSKSVSSCNCKFYM